MVLVMKLHAAEVSAEINRADSVHARQRGSSAPSRFHSRLFSDKSPKLNLCSCRAYLSGSNATTTFRSTAEDVSEQGEELLRYVTLAELVSHGADIPQKYLDSLPRTSDGIYMFKWRAVTLHVTQTLQQLRCRLRAKVDEIAKKINFAALTAADCRAALASADCTDDPLSSRVALLLLLSSRIALGLCSLQQQRQQRPGHSPRRRCSADDAPVDASATAAGEHFPIAGALACLHTATWERLIQLLPDVTAKGGWMQTMSDCGCKSGGLLVRITSSVSTVGFALLGPALSLLLVFVIWSNKKGLKQA